MSLLGTAGRMPRARTRTRSVGAPVKGWNTRDSIADMKPLYASKLDNYVPEDDDVRLRGGHRPHVTGIGSGAIESLITYNGPTASRLFAAGNSEIHNVTTAGAAGTPDVSGLASNRWEYENITTAGGSFLFMVNGSDAARLYDGTAWSNASISGVPSDNLAWVKLHHRRLFFGEEGKLEFAYLPVDSIGGAASTFPLGAAATKGGSLAGMVSWTRDSGSGMDDLAVFVTTEGEAIVYQGIDPSDANNWRRIGTFDIGKPIGRRFSVKFGADAILITEDGFLPLSVVLSTERGSRGNRAISDVISKTVNAAVFSARNNFGWEVIHYPGARWLLFNVPVSSGKTSHQFVFNSRTLAACRFTGMNALCWGQFNDDIFFGGTDGTVYRANQGADDNGQAIFGDILPAYSYFGRASTNKVFKLARPIFSSTGRFNAAIDMNTDFRDVAPTANVFYDISSDSVWDESLWDQAVWGGEEEISRAWQSVTGVGYAGALRVRTASSGKGIALKAITYVFEEGGIL